MPADRISLIGNDEMEILSQKYGIFNRYLWLRAYVQPIGRADCPPYMEVSRLRAYLQSGKIKGIDDMTVDQRVVLARIQNEPASITVRGKMILPPQGKEFFTHHGKQFFTSCGKEFFT